MSALRPVVLAVFRRVIRLYFREIEVVGAPAPDVGGRIFGANHVNGIVDPLVILTSVDCDVAPVAKSTLWKVPGMRWLLDVADAVPVVRKRDDPTMTAGSNDEVFDRVAAHLGGHGNILIFPEGTSHNEAHVVQLRSGAGRMLARAREKGAKGLSFQAVGLEFDARDEFRSRALVVFGPVREVDVVAGTTDDLPHAITDQLRADLTELIVEGDSWQDRLLIARVAEMLAVEGGSTSLAEWNAVGRRVEAVHRALAHEQGLHADVRAAVDDYYALVDASGLSDDRVRSGGGPRGTAHPLLLFLLAPLALLATFAYAIPYRIPRLARLFAKGETDVVSTYKLGISLLLFPLWALILVVLALIFAPSPWSWALAVTALVSPFAALPWLDRLDRSRLSRKKPGKAPTRDELLAARARALAAIDRAKTIAEERGAIPA
jgi:1-acyl-sn-glycerol-3-phosphate acyltransferase